MKKPESDFRKRMRAHHERQRNLFRWVSDALAGLEIDPSVFEFQKLVADQIERMTGVSPDDSK